MIKAKSAVLALSDGSVYQGWSLGKLGTVSGEVVFNTGMTGYQEILTDPSYFGQIVLFTYPELGNTGINSIDVESNQPFVKAIIAKNLCTFPSNWRNERNLLEYLQVHNIMCIYGLDTRSLTKHLRRSGVMNGVISNVNLNTISLLKQVQSTKLMEGIDLVYKVTSQKVSYYYSPSTSLWYFQQLMRGNTLDISMRVVVLDFGVKNNILRRLQDLNCKVIVVPAMTNVQTILAHKPNGVLLSNGPGDPSVVIYGIETVKQLLHLDIPLFGICMGHQLLSIALGCNTYKLKFGHRGLNHPIGWFKKVHITSQNHGFAVDSNVNLKQLLKVTHVNFNDGTIAGVSHISSPAFSVQYHPEASPGPHDADYLFAYFISTMYYYNSNNQKT